MYRVHVPAMAPAAKERRVRCSRSAWMRHGMRENDLLYTGEEAPKWSPTNGSYPFATDNVEPDDDLDDGLDTIPSPAGAGIPEVQLASSALVSSRHLKYRRPPFRVSSR